MTNNTLRLSGIVRAAAAALALALVPALAAAQTAPAKKASRPAPAEATSPAPAPRASSTLPYSINLAIGPSFEGTTALKLRFEGSMVMKPLFPNSTFELALPLGFAFWGQSYFGFDVSYFRLEVVPTARVSFPVAKDLGLYTDAGLGFVYYSASSSVTVPGFPTALTTSVSGAGGVFKLAGGGYYAIDPHWRLFVEPVGLNFYFGEGSGFVYTLMFGAAYRFQG